MKMFEDDATVNDAAALIFATLKEIREVPQKAPSRNISPSGLGCMVMAALKLNGVQPEPAKESFQSRCFAENGEDRHERIQAFLSQTPYWVDVEAYLASRPHLKLKIESKDGYELLLQHTELPIRFKCDGLLLIEGSYYLFEIKTESSRSNVYRTSYDPKHQLQGVCYTYLLDTSRILWLYEGRDMLEQRLFVQVVTPEEKDHIRKYISTILNNLNTIYNLPRSKACTYCDYKKHCREIFKQYKKDGLLMEDYNGRITDR